MKVIDYQPVNCNPCNAGCVQEMLAAQHWDTHRSLDQRKMWITGLYLGGVGTVLAKEIHPGNLVYFLLFLAGLIAFIAILKLHYLGELHIAKAQIYVGGMKRGIIFGFRIKEGKHRYGEEVTPKPSCACVNGFLNVFNLTSLYSVVVFYSALMCGYLFFPMKTNIPPSWVKCVGYIISAVIILTSYLVICHFESELKKHARRMALYNLSEGFHDVRRPADRTPTPPKK
jgi:hypothetical protein